MFSTSFSTTPYWWRAAPPVERPGPPPSVCDVAIVGAGYCGLSAAITLAEAGLSVVVLEAGLIGQGASTRNGGMVTGGQKFVVNGSLKGLGAERSSGILKEARQSLLFLKERINAHRLDADFQDCGRVILAAAPDHYRRLEGWCALLAKAGGDAEVDLVPPDRLSEEIGGDRYFGGLRIANYGGLHPAKYHTSLLALAESKGVMVVSNCRVTNLGGREGRHLLEGPWGQMSAGAVLVSTNGYRDGLSGFLQARIIPIKSYLIATETLPEGLADTLSPRRRMFSDSKRDLFYFRLSPDGRRVLFGARPGAFDCNERRAAVALYREMVSVWPALRGVALEHAWSGWLGLSRDKLPYIGCHNGVYFASGCNGSGVAMMSYLGHRVAEKILGQQDRPCVFDNEAFPSQPFGTASRYFLPLGLGLARLLDRLEQSKR